MVKFLHGLILIYIHAPLVSLGAMVPTVSPNSATRTQVAGASPSALASTATGRDAQGFPSRVLRTSRRPYRCAR
ncbi:MAG: hypothetical protein ACREX3_19690 [Gammaproteobacteria bacterium]